MKQQKLALYLPVYENIFRILHGVCAYANKDMPPSCQFYNVTGALILSKIYGIEAQPKMGAAFIKVDGNTGFTLAFADQNFEVCNSHNEAFHCWIETSTHIIDFTAPIYSEYPNSQLLPKLMFQKPYAKMSGSQMHLDAPGDFYFEENIELTKQLLKVCIETDKFRDFANIAYEWANRSRKGLEKNMKIQADDGEVIELVISQLKLTGMW